MSKIQLARVVCAFSGTGKSRLRHDPRFSYLKVFDMDEDSVRPWKRKDRDWPQGYVECLKYQRAKVDVVLACTVFDMLAEIDRLKIDYTLVYPTADQKEEYLRRYRERGSSPEWIWHFEQKFEMFIADLDEYKCPRRIRLNPGQHLSDVMDRILAVDSLDTSVA